MTADVRAAPPSVLVCESSSLSDGEHKLVSLVQRIHFNYKVSLLLPDCSCAPSDLDSVVNSFSSSVLVRNLPVYEFMDKDFLQTAVSTGSVCALSYGTRIDQDNCVALMPNGRLCLSLDRHSYHLLGVEGKASQRSKGRHVVSVDLTDRGRGPDRLRDALIGRLPLTCDFLLWREPGGSASLRPLLSRYDWSEVRPEVSARLLGQLTCPSDLRSCDGHSVMEWLGAVDADVSSLGPAPRPSSDFLSSWSCPGVQTRSSPGLRLWVRGFLTSHHVHSLIVEVRRFLEHSSSPWASLTVHAFTDAVILWREDERLGGGVDLYTLLMFKGGDYKLLLAAGSRDHDPCSSL